VGTATIQSGTIHQGGQAVEIQADSTISRDLDGTGESVVWAEGYYRGAGISGTPELPSSPASSAIIFFSTDNGIQCYDGDGSGGGSFTNTGVTLSATSWYKITVKLDFGSQTWDCWINDVSKATELGFRDNVTKFNGFMNFSKVASFLDDFQVVAPLTGDASLDGEVDIVDVIMLVNHLNSTPSQTNPLILSNMDVTDDGSVTEDDLTAMVEHILGL
jgi:hypothetical protein